MTSSILPDFPIKTHHIKSLHAPIGESYFLSPQPSMFLLQKSLCEQRKNQVDKLIQAQQSQLLNGDKNKIAKVTSRDYQTSVIATQQDVNKILTQIIQKGKKVDSLFKLNSATNSLILTKQQFEKYSCQNSYLVNLCLQKKSTSQLLLNEYFKKRKLGPKLRGLNSDLLIQIENKMFNLLQAQFKIWVSKKQTIRIQSDFTQKAEEISNYWLQMGQQTFAL